MNATRTVAAAMRMNPVPSILVTHIGGAVWRRRIGIDVGHVTHCHVVVPHDGVGGSCPCLLWSSGHYSYHMRSTAADLVKGIGQLQ